MGVPGKSLLAAALSLFLLAFVPPVISVGSAHWPCGCQPQAHACACPCPHPGMMGGMMMHGGMAPGMMRMEAMKEHLEQIRTTVAALRENEKTLAAAQDPAAFREAATEQFRMLGDILESHLRHMDEMMGRMPMGTMERPGVGTKDGAMPPDAGTEQHHR